MRNILLLEDDLALGTGIQMALRSETLAVTLCSTLAEARRLMEGRRFELLILDVNLPDGSGLGLLREVRRTGDVPVILLTANDLEVDIVTGLELGAAFTVTFDVDGQETTQTFVLSGWWEHDPVSHASHILIPESRAEAILRETCVNPSQSQDGMTGKQLKTMLVFEGLLYALGSILLALVLTFLLRPLLSRGLEAMVWFFTYRFTVTPILILTPVFALLGILTPLAVCRSVSKSTLVERLREAEG